jgi:hypothetical protein
MQCTVTIVQLTHEHTIGKADWYMVWHQGLPPSASWGDNSAGSFYCGS